MDHLSVNTFVRALSAASDPETPINLGKVAGDYENTTCTKIAKGVVGVLTLGIGYGIIWLIERFGNVSPKIDEFRQAASDLYLALEREARRIADGKCNIVFIWAGNKRVTFCQISGGVRISDGTRSGLLEGATLTSVKEKLGKDIANNAAAYARFRRPIEAVPPMLPVNEVAPAAPEGLDPGVRKWDRMNGAGIHCSAIYAGEGDKFQTMKVKATVHAQNVTSLTLSPKQRVLPDKSLMDQFSLSKVRSLRTLSVDMKHSLFLTKAQYGELAKIITSNPDLTKVELHLHAEHLWTGRAPAPDGVELPLLALTTLNKLEELSIDLSYMSDCPERGKIFARLGEVLKHPACRRIKNLSLWLRSSELFDKDLCTLLSGVTKIKELKNFNLDLRGNGIGNITPHGFACAFSMIKKMEMLESFLWMAKLEEKVNFEQLSTALRSLKNIKEICVVCAVWGEPYHNEFIAAMNEMKGRGVEVSVE